MAKISNPRKTFRFSIVITDPSGVIMEPFLVQEVNHPDVDVEPVSHGDVNFDIKTPGRVQIGNATINKLMRTTGADNYIWNWRLLCQMEGVGGMVPDSIKRDIIVTELAEGGDNIINTWRWIGCWPTKINGQGQNRQESENTIEAVEFSVDEVQKF
jgi:phage tail-like protein